MKKKRKKRKKEQVEKIQNLNIFLTIIIIIFTAASFFLMITQTISMSKQTSLMNQQTVLIDKLTGYIELSTRGDRLNQNRSIQEAKEFCKNNTEATDSGLYNINDAKSASCPELIKKYNIIIDP